MHHGLYGRTSCLYMGRVNARAILDRNSSETPEPIFIKIEIHVYNYLLHVNFQGGGLVK